MRWYKFNSFFYLHKIKATSLQLAFTTHSLANKRVKVKVALEEGRECELFSGEQARILLFQQARIKRRSLNSALTHTALILCK